MHLLISFHSESESHRFAQVVTKPFRCDGHAADRLALVYDVRGELALEGAIADLETAIRLLYTYFKESFSDYLFIDEEVPRTYLTTRAGSLVKNGVGIVRRSGIGLSWCLVDCEGRIALLNTQGGADIPYRAARDRFAQDHLTSAIWKLEHRTGRKPHTYSSPDGEGFVYTLDAAPPKPLLLADLAPETELFAFARSLQLDSGAFPAMADIITRDLRWLVPAETLFSPSPPPI